MSIEAVRVQQRPRSARRDCKRTCRKILKNSETNQNVLVCSKIFRLNGKVLLQFQKFWNKSKRFGFVPKFFDQMEKFCFCFKNFGTLQNVFVLFKSFQTTQKRPDFDYKVLVHIKTLLFRFQVFGLNRNVRLPFLEHIKHFGFVPIISFDIGTFVLPFWYN